MLEDNKENYQSFLNVKESLQHTQREISKIYLNKIMENEHMYFNNPITIIISGSLFIKNLEYINNSPIIKNVLIYCANVEKYQHYINKYKKIIFISNQLNDIKNSIHHIDYSKSQISEDYGKLKILLFLFETLLILLTISATLAFIWKDFVIALN